jgi:hypothetical protein
MEICLALALVRVRAREAVPAANELLPCQAADDLARVRAPARARALPRLRDRAREHCQLVVVGHRAATCKISSIYPPAAMPAVADQRPDPSVQVPDWPGAHWPVALLPHS